MPFEPPDQPVKLEQVGRNTFRLLEPFVYVARDGKRYPVTPAGVGVTDLASVPWILWWFVASYGRQTRPALLHDELVRRIDRHAADRLFRDALEDVGIGWVRRWLAWAAVSFETTFRTFGMPRDAAGVHGQRRGRWVTVVGFALVAAQLGAGVAALVWWGGRWGLLVGVALLAAWLLAWRIRALLFLLGAVVVGAPLPVLVASLAIVWILEGGPIAVARLAWWWAFRRHTPTPRPPVPPIGPMIRIEPRRV